MANNHITTTWKGDMKFESDNPSGHNLFIDAGEESGGKGDGYRPKALMLSALAGCSGLDVASLIKKMRLDVDDFEIKIDAQLTEEHPKYYDKVTMDFHFKGDNLDETKLTKAVDLSVEKYCGVMAMFQKFAEVKINIFFNK
ncbi:putative redox protein [Zhouia amylolytica]|uniref:OsmC family protein n=2 Tax=Zhouia amylolytica TaxID=376730 RepID=W2UMU1_9FLAO|nr:OsmC family protein [Zhouia amylolytica]ETN94776.1 OsmC family protein [Zhouia amylolytica AD3]MCQ0110960.1 OsmC family protein [Zhouia amylolytica]SFS73448.1 putative redox protein [Zhouia amylolytica]